MKYNLTEATAILNNINFTETPDNEDSHRKMTIRLSAAQERFFQAVQSAMLPGSSMSDAISLGLEVVRQSTRNSNTLYQAKQFCLYDVLLQHNVNPHEINTLLTLLGLNAQPMMDLGNKERFTTNLTDTEKQCLIHFFNLNRTYLSEPFTAPYLIRELMLANDIEYLKKSEYAALQPRETLLLIYHPETDIDEYLIVKQIEYALNLTKSFEVFQPIGRLMLMSGDSKLLKEKFVQKAESLNMRVFKMCVDESVVLRIRNGSFFTAVGQKMQGVAQSV